jgi:hypothetical protein
MVIVTYTDEQGLNRVVKLKNAIEAKIFVSRLKKSLRPSARLIT